MKNRTTEQLLIENMSKRRYELFGVDYNERPDGEEMPVKVEKEIDDLADKILNCIKTYHYSLPFEFVFEELTKLGWAPCLLYDDDGHFAISGDGMQSIPMDSLQETGSDWISHHIVAGGWFPTIRQALEHYLNEEY